MCMMSDDSWRDSKQSEKKGMCEDARNKTGNVSTNDI